MLITAKNPYRIMKKSYLFGIVGGVLVIGAAFYLFQRFKKKSEAKLDANLQPPQTPLEQVGAGVQDTTKQIVAAGGDLLGQIGASVGNYLSAFNPYTVNTVSSSLYIRETPDAKGKVIGKYAKGTVVQAKPSKTKGWFEVTDDGKTVKGYVSSVYLKAQPLKK